MYSTVELSPDYAGYIINCLGPNIPYTAVLDLPSNTLRFVLDTNKHLTDFLATKDLPFTQTFEVCT